METPMALALVSSAVCAVVLAWSGVEKLRRPGRSAVALVRFGLAHSARRAAGRALGLLECVVAAALVAWPVSLVPLAAAALLFGGFTTLIALALRRGTRFDCGCLGERETLGRHTLGRAAALLTVAGAGVAVALTEGDPSGFAAIDRAVGLAVGALLVAQVAVIVALRRSRPFDPALRGTGG